MAPDPAGALAACSGAGVQSRSALAALTALSPDQTLAVCVPDLTRPLDPRAALEAVRAHCRARLRVVLGLGLHRPLSAAELAPLAAWGPAQSDPDDCVVYGAFDGVPGTITRAVAEADAVISIGVAELHQYAGVSGGHKGAVVGCGGRQTIAALHDRARVTHPAVRLGVAADNPFREAIDQLGAQLGVGLALNHLALNHLAQHGPGPGLWLAGDPRAVTRAAIDLLDPWRSVSTPAPGAVLRVPQVKARSLYQASRAATYLASSPAPPLLPGATLILDAACPEGLGAEAGFVAALTRSAPPWAELLTGPAPTGAGAQRAVMLALFAQRYRLVVRGCRSAAALRAVGLDASAQPAECPPGWLDIGAPFSRLPQLAGGPLRG